MGVFISACGSSTSTGSGSSTPSGRTPSTLGTPGTFTCVAGSLSIAGSTALIPLAQQGAKHYQAKCPGANITVYRRRYADHAPVLYHWTGSGQHLIDASPEDSDYCRFDGAADCPLNYSSTWYGAALAVSFNGASRLPGPGDEPGSQGKLAI